MEVRRLRILGSKIFKTLNGLNTKFYESLYSTHKEYNFNVHSRNTSKYGDKSLRLLGAHIWNSLPDSGKHETSMNIFKVTLNMVWPKMQMLSL